MDLADVCDPLLRGALHSRIHIKLVDVDKESRVWDVHSIMDYAASLTAFAGAVVTETPESQLVSAALAASGLGVSACIDYRLSAARLVSIKAHEVIDYIWGAAAIAAPFALGCSKKDLVAAALHIFAGASTILSSLFTDYRSAAGVGHTPKLKEG